MECGDEELADEKTNLLTEASFIFHACENIEAPFGLMKSTSASRLREREECSGGYEKTSGEEESSNFGFFNEQETRNDGKEVKQKRPPTTFPRVSSRRTNFYSLTTRDEPKSLQPRSQENGNVKRHASNWSLSYCNARTSSLSCHHVFSGSIAEANKRCNSYPNCSQLVDMAEYRYRRYSAISAPAASLLTSIIDDEETRNDEYPVQEKITPCAKQEDSSKKTTSSTVTSDSECKKSMDELRKLLVKRWHQLVRHRLVVLHFVLTAYLLAFLITYICKFQGQTQISTIVILCILMAYCAIVVLLCVACPLISARPLFISLVSLTTATLWPVLIWLLTLCCIGHDSEEEIYIDKSSWKVDGMPSMILYISALYTCLSFPIFIDAVWGVLTSILHLILTYVRWPDRENPTQQICANILILFVTNLFGIFVSIALRRSREFMYREFDDSIEKRASVEYEKERQETLLLSIIPAHLAARVRKAILNRASKTRESIDTTSEQPRLFHDLHVQQHENVSILFADIVNFTPLTAELTAPQLVRFLNELYSRFDEIAQEFQCMRIKILGDCYYCVSGMPVSRPNHADNCVKMALAMIEAIKSLREGTTIVMDMRIGVHSGSVLCGILGLKKWQYDIWSDDVTIANHMEQGGQPGKVHITKATLQLLTGDYNIVPAITKDAYILSQNLDTYFILPYPNSETAPSDVLCTSVEDISVAMNGCSAPLAQMQARESPRQGSPRNRRLKVFTPSSKQFDRIKSFSFRQYHGTTDMSSNDDQKSSRTHMRIPKNVPQSLTNQSLLSVYQQRQKMSKIIEFWGGADTPFSNLSRRRSSDHVRAASITAIENNYKQYRWRDLLSMGKRSDPITNVCCPGTRRRDSGTASNMLLDGALIYIDKSVEDSFYENAQPFPTAASTTIAAVLTFFVGVIGSICMLIRPDVVSSVLFGGIMVFLCVIAIIQWHRRLSIDRKINYVPPFTAFESYESLSRCIVPGFVLMLAMSLSIIFLAICAQPGNCSNSKYDVCLFQIVILLITANCRPGFVSRCGIVFVYLLIFITIFFYANHEDGIWPFAIIGNSTFSNTTVMQTQGLSALPFQFRATFNVLALLLLVISVSWLMEYEAKVDWLCVASFRGEQEDVETMQDINMILLHNILPNHVAAYFLRPERPPEELYHENHPYVCVMFASIPNFKDFWSQWDFSRQLECLRLLNEIVCEFDKLLAKLKFSNIEKIKTVGSTYMAVCGLHSNPAMQLDPRRFTVIMVEFAFSIMNLLEQINRDAFQNFQLRIGMNFGPVIAGVIGAQKPQYDIWGNTVNVASRMDTHGVMGKIHVTQDTAAALQACGYEVESRGLIKIKGIKNEIETYFVHAPSDRRSMAY